MKVTFSGLAIIAAGIAMMVTAVPGSAQAGSVVDDLRSRGLGKWVDRYVEEDDKGKVSYKSSNSSKTTTQTTPTKTTASPAKAVTTNTVKANAPISKTLKKVSKKKAKKKFTAKKSKKTTTRKLAKKKVKKKFVSNSSTNKVSSNTKKKYKVPSRVKDRLASYGINF